MIKHLLLEPLEQGIFSFLDSAAIWIDVKRGCLYMLYPSSIREGRRGAVLGASPP
jgi:hypothetical protein